MADLNQINEGGNNNREKPTTKLFFAGCFLLFSSLLFSSLLYPFFYAPKLQRKPDGWHLTVAKIQCSKRPETFSKVLVKSGQVFFHSNHLGFC